MVSMDRKFESRICTGSELRTSQGDEMALVGYAATFGVLSHDLGGFRERIQRGAFDRSLREQHDVRALLNHDPNFVLGRTSAGTLQLEQDDKGLKFRCQLDRNQQSHRDLHSSVKRGDVCECSFCFRVPGPSCDVWDEGTDERGAHFARRTLLDVDLLDCSVVCAPAYPGTSVSARSARAADHEAWKKAMLLRADRIAKVIEYERQMQMVEDSQKTGYIRVRTGPGEWDWHYESMTDAEFDRHLRRRAEKLGKQIHEDLAAADRTEPAGAYVWNFRAGCWVPRTKENV